MKLLNCTYGRHGTAVREILNHAIVHTTALYDYEPRSSEAIEAWFAEREAAGFPVVGAEDEGGALVGFATYGEFRRFPAYYRTVEHSVYVRESHRGGGVGRCLMNELISRARSAEMHAMIGVIDAENVQSIAFHEQLGFCQAGVLREVGWKFERWLDVVIMQLLLDGVSSGSGPVPGG